MEEPYLRAKDLHLRLNLSLVPICSWRFSIFLDNLAALNLTSFISLVQLGENFYGQKFTVDFFHVAKLYIPSTIHIWKKVLTKAIWADKKWAGFWQISLYIK